VTCQGSCWRSECRRVGFGWLAALPGEGALERFDGAGVIDVDERVELPGGAGREVVALAFGLRSVDDADRALKARFEQSMPAVARTQRAQQEGGDPRGVQERRTFLRSAGASQSEAAVTVPV